MIERHNDGRATDWKDTVFGRMAVGHVAMPRPTGRYVRDPDGYVSEQFTDWIDYDRDGREIGRAPWKPVVRMAPGPVADQLVERGRP